MSLALVMVLLALPLLLCVSLAALSACAVLLMLELLGVLLSVLLVLLLLVVLGVPLVLSGWLVALLRRVLSSASSRSSLCAMAATCVMRSGCMGAAGALLLAMLIELSAACERALAPLMCMPCATEVQHGCEASVCLGLVMMHSTCIDCLQSMLCQLQLCYH